ncbi:5-formyltetrahydrofolate cyclo-ligase [uncultured Thalassolituus sp.]|uniref:5-formyltetrahydrofolate cyclo-ligase n=1 Tax=uncultured Thalassolituus sp. TaxID=285273 RepID=UPI00262308BF|nr:5-formyltetrahydrofolate cyclo-ligase [uncultured Thalassolituus sp.]
MNKKELRRLIRQKRRDLTPSERNIAGRRLLKQLTARPEYLYSHRVALYLSNDGEIDPQWAIQDLWKRGKQAFLPVLHPLRKGELVFIRYARNTPMRNNRFGISEPDFRRGKQVSARFLSLICLPLVAFDSRGNRLGMGGGFYDRTLAFTHHQGQKPRLAGCAYAFQEVRLLPAESWDIPLQLIVTDQEARPLSADTGL